ncbi:lytic murein transglycosylase [Shewanella khirikhana]|uniref:Membrane-bound lytic murein transglycosylase B n=1 Tax=Shewanella khirikhana TaxID=1965282 RepID=A0ABM7DAW7_9GAMM|nr:lytic murein transglycosylase [Shewanella khirikhana]AZQ10725.1 Membrane-bound lytic murein transglycosylase B precursor [Shewanella khirikhana]
MKSLLCTSLSALALLSGVALAEDSHSGSFADYLEGLRKEALERHDIRPETISAVFPKVKEFRLAKSQNGDDEATPESAGSLDKYLPSVLTDTLVDEAKFQYQGHSETLTRIGDAYGVQPRFIVALWGLESRYGRESGAYPVLSVTASKAYRGVREAFYREQFFAALNILDSSSWQLEQLLATPDGRMGQPKLLPAGFLAYAKDGDDDGKADIWTNPADVFASIASFMKESGWRADETWGRQVKIPADFDVTLASSGVKKGFADWQALGVRRFDGTDLPARSDMLVTMVMPDGPKGRVYLVYDNYLAIKRWRDSDYFALALVHLSDRIKFQLGE